MRHCRANDPAGPGERRIRTAGVELHDRLRMRGRVGVQAAQPAKLVGVRGDIRQEFGEPGTRLAVLLEGKFRGGQFSAARAALAVVLLQRRLVVEGVRPGHCPLHEDEDDALGLGLEMRGARG